MKTLSSISRENLPRAPLFGVPWHHTRWIAAVATGLGVLYTAWLVGTSYDLGFARDEGFYFQAARDYSRWFELLFSKPLEAIKQSNVDPIWSENHEHPSLMKSLFSLSWMFLHKKWHLFHQASTAFRFPGMAMGGLAVGLTYAFAARLFTPLAGLFGAIALMMMPHTFYNAHLACFDIGVMAMWIACIYAYWEATQRRTLLSAIGFGIIYGLTLETKHNAWILPGVFIPHALYVARRELREDIPRGKFSIPTTLLSMFTLGPAVFYLLWPWMWNDTIPRFKEYFDFHVHHVYYNMEFLGKNVYGPPSPKLYMPLLIVASVPSILLLLAIIGGAYAKLGELRRWIEALPLAEATRERVTSALAKISLPSTISSGDQASEPILLLLLGIAAPLAVFFLPTTPIFGGTKHWMTAYPLLAMLAGLGFEKLSALLAVTLADRGKASFARVAEPAFFALCMAAPFLETQHSHPFGLSAYVPIVGGTAGGADLGLNRQFWGYTTQSVAPYFAKQSPRTSVFIHDTAWQSWEQMQVERRVPPELRATGSPGEAELSLVHHELHMNEVDYQIWVAYEHTYPDWVLTHDGVPIVSVYKRQP